MHVRAGDSFATTSVGALFYFFLEAPGLHGSVFVLELVRHDLFTR